MALVPSNFSSPLSTLSSHLHQAVEMDVEKEVEEAAQFALSSPTPKPEELYTNIYSDSPGLPVRGRDPFTWGQHFPKAMAT